MMPKIDGLEVCRQLKRDTRLPFIPMILVTAKADTKRHRRGPRRRRRRYLTKPVDQAALVARVRSMLRIKALHDTVRAGTRGAASSPSGTRRSSSASPSSSTEIERIGRLQAVPAAAGRRADRLLGRRETLLESHRREITVVFCDLRGFTAFAETARARGGDGGSRASIMPRLASSSTPTRARWSASLGDGLMVCSTIRCPARTRRARRRMAVEMRDGSPSSPRAGASSVTTRLRRRHREGRSHARPHRLRGAPRLCGDRRGSNLAARLCSEAKAGQVLVSEPVFLSVKSSVEAAHLGQLVLKGFQDPVPAYAVTRWREGDAAAA